MQSLTSNENSLKGCRVLLVEDNLMNQFFARQLMENWEITVDTAQNGHEAISLATSRLYDIILMDIQMPQLDGLQATRQLRQQHRLSIPIIALTALSAREDIELFRQVGMDDYLVKPFMSEELRKKLITYVPKPRAQLNGSALQVDIDLPPLPLFNTERLALMLNYDAARMHQMEELFIRQTRETIQRMRSALAVQQREEVGKLAHKIKASVDLMDIDSLKRPIRTLEALGKQNEPSENFASLTDQICHTLEQVCQQLEASH